jgi:hypothetical protein
VRRRARDPRCRIWFPVSACVGGACLLLGSSFAFGADLPAFRQDDVAPRTEQPAFRQSTVAPRTVQPGFRNTAPPPILDAPSSAPSGLDGVTRIPPGGYQADQTGLAYSTLFRNTRFPVGNPVIVPPVEATARTENVTAGVSVKVPTLSMGLPFLQRGFEPQNADLKAGPFYFKLVAIQGAILHSDNINQTPERESGTIAIATATINMMAQFTESLRAATSVTLVYFPIEGKAGIAGFQFTDLYELGLFAGPVTRAQLAWDTKIAGWDVLFRDEFQVSLGAYSDDYRNDYELFEGNRFNEESRAGRYYFRAPGNNSNSTGEQRKERSELGSDFIVYSNEVSAEADRLLPGTIRLQARVYHENLWYNQGNRGLPSLREGGSVILASERVNTRFKPFVSYEAFRADSNDSFQSIFRVGVAGPITDHLSLRADAGYYFGGSAGEGSLWTVALDHNPNPYIRQSLIYTRTFDDFHQEIEEGIGYNYHQIIGPRLTADAYIYDLDAELSGDSDVGRHELRTGIRFTLAAGPKTTIRLTGNYATNDENNVEYWTGRLEIGYNFSDTLLARFLYQYRRETSDFSSDNFEENLFFLSLTKSFN